MRSGVSSISQSSGGDFISVRLAVSMPLDSAPGGPFLPLLRNG